LSSSSQRQKGQTHKKPTKKIPKERRELTFKLSLCPLTFGSRFKSFCFKHFLLASFSFQVKEKKKNAEKGRNFPSSSHFAFSVLVLASTLPLLPFCFKRFLLASSYSQTT
jgi:hypothetical protein